MVPGKGGAGAPRGARVWQGMTFPDGLENQPIVCEPPCFLTGWMAQVISVSPLGAIELRFDDDTVQTTDAADVAGPEVMRCFSRNDEITDEELKDAHVCWSSPDGSCRMCFNLSTLRKVALSVGQV